MEKILICYWSGTGNTEIMADEIEAAIINDAEVTKVTVDQEPSIDGYDKIMLGCPAMGDEVLEEGEFEPWFSSIEGELGGKKVALFGSYGWGDGEWMRQWEEQCTTLGADVFDPTLIINYTPDDEGKEECAQFAKDFLKY